MVPPNSGQRLKNRASAKVGTYGSAVSQWCNRLYRALIPYRVVRGGKGFVVGMRSPAPT
jgi:hypothetical protein